VPSPLESLHPGATAALLCVVLLVVLLIRGAPDERRSTLRALAGFVVSLVALAVARLLEAQQFTAAAGYLRSLAQYAEGLFVLYLATAAIFRVLLPAARLVTPRILQDVVSAAGYVVWTFVWLRINHVDLTSIVATSAVVTAVVGLSLQDTLGNILAGVAIQTDRSIQVGDWLQIEDISGRVVEIRWRYTALETRDWEAVVIPNSALVKNRFLVLGRRHGKRTLWRRAIPFNVDFRYPPSRVLEAVNEALRDAELPGVAPDPRPCCVLSAFTDSVCRYEVLFWLADLGSDRQVLSRVAERVYSGLQRGGVPLAIPAQSVFLTEETEERRARKSERVRERGVEVLRRLDLFRGLSPDELHRLAGRLAPSPFTRGEVITRQGDRDDWLYLLVSGEADVLVENDQCQRRHVATLTPGSFFGEMALMTGEPRSATVMAKTDVECYRLDRAAFQDIIQARPELAEGISTVLAGRREGLEAVRSALDAENEREDQARTRRELLDRIRRFFLLQ
jgi:small-conductance mechanosensitive channel/CRP-like cAMP-binding protein